MVYSTRRFVVCLTMCHLVLVFFSPLSIAITSLGEERANLSAFRTFVRFVLVWTCRFPLPLSAWEGLRFMIVALPGLFPYLFCDCGTPWTSLGEERELILVLFVRLFDLCLFGRRFSLPLSAWEGLRFVIVALPGLFSYLFCDCGTPWTFL